MHLACLALIASAFVCAVVHVTQKGYPVWCYGDTFWYPVILFLFYFLFSFLLFFSFMVISFSRYLYAFVFKVAIINSFDDFHMACPRCGRMKHWSKVYPQYQCHRGPGIPQTGIRVPALRLKRLIVDCTWFFCVCKAYEEECVGMRLFNIVGMWYGLCRLVYCKLQQTSPISPCNTCHAHVVHFMAQTPPSTTLKRGGGALVVVAQAS